VPGRCSTLLSATLTSLLVAPSRGSAERKRTTASLRFSLAVEAEAALAKLQVSSPSTWQRPASRTGPERVLASLQTLR
jgi:hypothetical protein